MTFEEIQKKSNQEWKTFSVFKRPRILIGAATCGRAAGAKKVRAAFEKVIEDKKIDVDIYEVGCIGMCYAEPLVEIALPDGRRVIYGDMTGEKAEKLIEDFIQGDNPHPEMALATCGDVEIEGIAPVKDLPMMQGQVRIVLRNAGIIDPTNVYHYVARGGYSGLEKALKIDPEKVIETVFNSGLRGRGGAGFPTGLKWGFARKAQSDEKYVICNADEGDPGAFMDRSVIESDPHAVLEGLTIAGYAVGASQGYIYVRAEYPLAIERLTEAIKQMEELNLIGDDIMGSSFSFHVKIKKGAGAFVCGEETALMASIEGQRGMPRSRPPFPAQSGLHEKPTNINNVETLANVSEILNKGADWYTQYGTEKSRGTKTFALAGKINHTGLIEVPMGIILKDVIFNIGGGIPNDKKLKAVQTGGPSGGCIPADMVDMPVDYEKLAEAGSIMGSGGMVVMDEDNCMVDIARYFTHFTRDESCGKCVPCRMGSQHLPRLLCEIADGKGTEQHLVLLKNLAETIKSGSLCGLGQTLPNPVLSTLKYFHDEYEAHIKEKQCPAKVCKELFYYTIDEDICKEKACGICKRNCSYGAIEGEKRVAHKIITEKCTKCGMCFDVCPFGAVKKV
ncbi:MAG: NADH-quinone oxidoreductase subunit NuoF [Candidatus Omnitrophica bacterium]|nr:NADH-quinone oxidoreductase subunit NuoF [Candidatus Omnitrophota bacterium]